MHILFQQKHVALKAIINLFPVDIVIAIYIPFIKLLLYIKRGQTKGLEVCSNLLKFVVNFIYIWEYHTSKPHQKRSRKTQTYKIR